MQKKWMRLLCAVMAIGLCLGGASAETLSSDTVLEIERALYSLGYHDENFDALMDDVTRRALRSFQTANGLSATGEADQATLQLLAAGTGVSCREYLLGVKEKYDAAAVLQAGNIGDAVAQLQRRLKELGYFSGECDGVFGDATLAAVCRFQMANGLTETGMADRSTQLRLNEGKPLSWQSFLESSISAFGDTGLHVRQMQRKLSELGYFTGDCTGSYGELTQQAVSRFQENNGIESTGMADLITCTMLYTGAATPLKAPGTLRTGDANDEVAQLQTWLSSYGYYDRNITGVFGATTEIAVRLCQMTNGLPATGEADEGLLAKLFSGGVESLDNVRESLREQLHMQGDNARTVIGNVAMRLRGQSFEPDDEDLYEGFAFVQYVCVLAGIPVVYPEDLMELAAEPVVDYSVLQAGDVLAVHSADGRILLAVSAGNGSAIYATQDSGYVLETDLRSLVNGELRRWNMSANAE